MRTLFLKNQRDRICIETSFLTSLFWYFSQFISIPPQLIKQIEIDLSHFLWKKHQGPRNQKLENHTVPPTISPTPPTQLAIQFPQKTYIKVPIPNNYSPGDTVRFSCNGYPYSLTLPFDPQPGTEVILDIRNPPPPRIIPTVVNG